MFSESRGLLTYLSDRGTRTLLMSISFVILQASTLSFLGMGVQAPAPEWGFMLSEAKEYARSSSYLLMFPGVTLCLTALSFNLVGDGLRDALDPRLKN